MTILPALPEISGSSPLARGLLVEISVVPLSVGIIPARAGFTGGGHSDLDLRGDHPRSRGVYYGRITDVTPFTGSSPLARGLLTVLRRF